MKLREFGVDLNLDFLYCKFWTEACERCEDLRKVRWHSSTLCFWFRNFHSNSSYCDIYTIHFLHGGNTINRRMWIPGCCTNGWNDVPKWTETVQNGPKLTKNDHVGLYLGKLCEFCCFLCFLCEKLKHKLFLSSI